METKQHTPTLETLNEEDKALSEMYQGDTNGEQPLSPEDEATYRELIESQRSAHLATSIEVKDASGEKQEVAVHSIGDRPLGQVAVENSMMAVHSQEWHTEEK